jgi:hypothetical protein
MTTKTMFYGVGAWVGKVLGEKQVAFWPLPPEEYVPPFDPKKLLEVDLAKAPAHAKTATDWAALQADDHVNLHGSTTLGPFFPDGTSVGAVYMPETYLRKLKLWPWKQPALFNAQDYEFHTVIYREDDGSFRRFRGTYARVIQIKGNLAEVLLYGPGTSGDPTPKILPPQWFDLNDGALFDPPANGLTELSIPANKREGALFIAPSLYEASFGYGPKIPAGSDEMVVTMRHHQKLASARRAALCAIAPVTSLTATPTVKSA